MTESELKRAASAIVIQVGVALVQTCQETGNKGAPASVMSLAMSMSGVPDSLSDRLLQALEVTGILKRKRNLYYSTPAGEKWARALCDARS